MLDRVQIGRIANEVLAKSLGNAGYDRSKIDERPGDEEGSGLYVTVIFKDDAPPTSGKASAEAMEAFVDALRAEGETRFPHLIFDYPDDERPYEIDVSGQDA